MIKIEENEIFIPPLLLSTIIISFIIEGMGPENRGSDSESSNSSNPHHPPTNDNTQFKQQRHLRSINKSKGGPADADALPKYIHK